MFIILFFLFPIILSAESYCDSGEEVSLFNCSETNRALSDERVLYTRPIFAGRCCYKDKKCILAICSHEGYAILENISKEDLKKIGIKL